MDLPFHSSAEAAVTTLIAVREENNNDSDKCNLIIVLSRCVGKGRLKTVEGGEKTI